MTDSQEKIGKSFFERMGEILNSPLPGTEATPVPKSLVNSDEAGLSDDDTLLARVKDILNTPLPGSVVQNDNEVIAEDTTQKLPKITQTAIEENWWETDWAEFKAHQDQDRKGVNMKQRMDQEGFAQYQEQERLQFEVYQGQEFEIFQRQQQAKLNWIQEQQMAQAAGVQITGMVPPPPPVAPLPPEMPIPPWM